LAHGKPSYELSDESNEGFRKFVNDLWWHNQLMGRLGGY